MAVSVILIACITVVVVFNVMNKNDDTKTTTVTKENTAKKGNLTVGITEAELWRVVQLPRRMNLIHLR